MSKPINKEYLETQLKNFNTSVLNKKYVSKVDGMGLSQENFTTELKNKLDGLENVDYSSIEERIAELPTKEYIAEQIESSNHLVRKIVTTVPSVSDAKENIIYMLKVDSATGADKYKEYMLIDNEVVLIGDTSIDLSEYAKNDDLFSGSYNDLTDVPEFENEAIDFSTF